MTIVTVIDFGSLLKIINLISNVVAKVTDVTMSSGVEMSPIPLVAKKITITIIMMIIIMDHIIILICMMYMEVLVRMEQNHQ